MLPRKILKCRLPQMQFQAFGGGGDILQDSKDYKVHRRHIFKPHPRHLCLESNELEKSHSRNILNRWMRILAFRPVSELINMPRKHIYLITFYSKAML